MNIIILAYNLFIIVSFPVENFFPNTDRKDIPITLGNSEIEYRIVKNLYSMM